MNHFKPLFIFLFLVLGFGQVSANSPNSNSSKTETTINCASPTNLALNKTAYQSSTITANGITGSASKAVDGYTYGVFFTGSNSTSSVSATTNQFQAYWEVDLGAEYNLDQVRIWNRTDGTDKTEDCYLLISNTPLSADLNTALDQATYSHYAPGPVLYPSTDDLPTGTTGRYVRIQLQNTGYVVLAEVEVFGCAIGGGGTPTVSIGDLTVSEDVGNANLQLNLSAPSPTDVTVNYSTDNGTATSLNDFFSGSGMITFPAGSTTASVAIPISDDNVFEPTESFVVNFTNPTGATLANSQATITINDNDAPGLPSASINNVTVDEDAGSANFTVTLSAPSTTPVTVNYTTADATAMNPGDYTTTAGTVTIPAGMTTASITVLLNDDTTDEPSESFVVNLSNPVGATIAAAQGTATINDNDGGDPCLGSGDNDGDGVCNAIDCFPWNPYIPGPIGAPCDDGNPNTINDVIVGDVCTCIGTTPGGDPNLVIGNVTVNENALTATLPLTLSAPATSEVTVSYATANGSAMNPGDYSTKSGTATFPIGSTTASITIDITDDNVNEPTEAFVVNLSNPSGATIVTPQGTVTINDNDAPGLPSVSINNVTVDEDGGNANFTVTLSAPSTTPVTVSYATANGSAITPGDYVNSNGTVTFPIGSTTASISIPLTDDNTDEPTETFVVNLANPSGATIATPQGTATINDNDAPGLPSVSINNVTVDEDGGNANFTVTLSAPATSEVTVSYATANGSAITPGDYVNSNGTVTFPIGSTTASISIPLTDDNTDEPTESFVVNLTNPSGATIATPQGTATINDNDAPGLPSVSINNVTVDEDGGNANFTVTLSAPATSEVTVSYATANGSAITPGDYVNSNGTVTFPIGSSTASISIPLTDDNTEEPTEAFVVNLTNPSGATIATPQGTATINDNDAPPGGCAVTVTSDGCTITISGITDAVANIKVFNPGYNGAAWSCNPWQGSPCNVTETITGLANGTYPVTVLTSDANGQPVCNINQNITIDCSGSTPVVSVNDVTVSEDGTSAIFTVSLSAPSSLPITINYATADGTATNPSDYTTTAGTITFPVGSTTQSIVVPITDDNILEPTESLVINLTDDLGNPLAQGTATINDDDVAPLPLLSIDDVNVNEMAGTASLTITASAPSTNPIFVTYTTNPGTALEGLDYTPVNVTAIIPVGQTSTTVFIPLNNDLDPEQTEEFTVVLSNPNGATIGDGTATITVADDDVAPLPLLSIDDINVNEMAGTASLTITASAPSTSPIFVTYTTNPGTALEGLDYTPVNATAIIPAGQTSTTVFIPLNNDLDPEQTEEFTVVLSNPNGATIGDGTATITITDNDSPCLTQGGDTDGDGVCNNDDCQPFDPFYPTTAGTPCDDGDANTENDVVTADGCGCAGVIIDPCLALGGDTDGDGVCDDDDCQPLDPFFPTTAGTACDDGDADTENDVVTADGCGCAGIDPCLALGGDTDGDGICDDDDCQPLDPFFPATAGIACDDGDANTENDVVTADGCDCAGVVINPCLAIGGIDTDGDGICDGDDCQPYNGNIPTAPGTPCDDGMANTINDVIASDGCGCAGQLVAPVCNFLLVNHKDWENNQYGFWNDGGHSCHLSYSGGANGSQYSVRLRDNDGAASSTFTDHLNLSNVSKVKIDFMVRFESMEYGEDLLLEYSTNGGSSFQTTHQWIRGQNIENSSTFSNIVVEIEANFSSQTVFRFRCDASSSLDKVYLDDIKLSKCIDYNDPYAGQRPTYRTIDGTLNNFDNPIFGLAATPLVRKVPSQYADGVGAPAGQNRPNARHISNQLSDEPRDENRKDERLLSAAVYQFGQFLDHDIISTGGPGAFEFQPIIPPLYDPIFAPGTIIPFVRTAPVPGITPRQQPNFLTAYIDGSNVYGAEPVRAAWLRTFQGGKLKTSKGNLLPYNTLDGEFESPIDSTAPLMQLTATGDIQLQPVAGDVRANENANLTAFHLIFVREHNRICDVLISQGETDDEIIYQKARKLVGGIMQKIIYEEFLPAVGVQLDPYTGYNSSVNPGVRNLFATAAYRWHTMVTNDAILRNDACEAVGESALTLPVVFQNPQVIRNYGPGVLLRGLSFHPQLRTDLKVTNSLRSFSAGPGVGADLVSFAIQRGRDHGLPDYNTVRQAYGLSPVSNFSDINHDYHVHNRIAGLYSDINDIDAWVGMFAEPVIPGTSLGSTATAIVKEQFEAMRDGDFYFYQNDPFLSSDDLAIINSSTLSNVITRNSNIRTLTDNIFFKAPCDNYDPKQNVKDVGTPVCFSLGATFFNSCSSTSGTGNIVGMYNPTNVQKINVELGFAVRIINNQGESTYYTDDTGCLPTEFSGSNIVSVEVICLSADASTVSPVGHAGTLFDECFSTPLPITTPGFYTTEQLKSLNVGNDMVSAIRVNTGFSVTIFEHDNFQGNSWTYTGPTVACLPYGESNKMSSMQVAFLPFPQWSNCAFNNIGGAVFQKDANDVNAHIGVNLGIGDYDMARLNAIGAGNDNTKQIKVNNGYAITLFEDDNFEGNYTVYLGDESDLSTTISETSYPLWDIFGLFPYTNTTTMHDNTSSLKVRCIESLQTSTIAQESTVTLTAEKEEDKARLEVTYDLTKEAIYQSLDKYNGKTGEFEPLETFAVDNLADSYAYYDVNTMPGDNIYRLKVIYADGTEEETPYRTVRFDALFHVYPNPVSDIVNIDLQKYEGSDVEVTIYDIRGVEVTTKSIPSIDVTTVSFDLSSEIDGTYVVRVVADGKRAISKKFILAKRN